MIMKHGSRNMIKVLVVSLLLLALGAVVACGGSSAPSSAPAADAPAAAPKSIPTSVPKAADSEAVADADDYLSELLPGLPRSRYEYFRR